MYPSLTASRVATTTITTETTWVLPCPSLGPEQTRAGVRPAARGEVAAEAVAEVVAEEEDGAPRPQLDAHPILTHQVEGGHPGGEMVHVHRLEEERLQPGMLREWF